VEEQADLHSAIERLARDPAVRVALGKRALEIGRQYFTHEKVQTVFYKALSACD